MTADTNRKRAALHTLGCRLNQAETAIIESRLIKAGYTLVPFGDAADLGIVNTCTVTNEASAKSRKTVRAFARKNPKAVLAVIGCYSQIAAQEIADIDGVDLVIGNREKLNVVEYVRGGKRSQPLVLCDPMDRDDFFIDTDSETRWTRRANLKIQDGCDFMCSFCVIPFARGRARSRNMDNALEEARQLVGLGAKELVLTGVNLGTYAQGPHGIVDLIDRLNEIDGLSRVRISSIEPTTIPEALFERMDSGDHALLPYLHIPIQSGSDRVLERMGRRYDSASVLRFLEGAVEHVDGLCVGTDIMVGMPGETDDDFERSCQLLLSGPFAYAHVFKYSERKGTAATRLGQKVPAETKIERSAVIRRIGAQALAEFHRRHTGERHEVLFEQEEDGHWFGYTGNYIRVAVCSSAILKNSIHTVYLEEPHAEFVTGFLGTVPSESSSAWTVPKNSEDARNPQWETTLSN